MPRDEQPQGMWSPMRKVEPLGITLVLLLMLPPLLLKASTGILLTLFGSGSLLSGLALGWYLGRSGAPSPIGPTFNSQGAFPQPQTTKYDPCSKLKVYPEFGEPRSPK